MSYAYCFQTSWSIPVELVIGPDLGISCMAHRGGSVVSMTVKAFLKRCSNRPVDFFDSHIIKYIS